VKTVSCVDDLRHFVSQVKKGQKRIALVPTMGNLHEGHLALVREAKQLADVVIVSIFVNPLQFGPDEDFERYPRSEVEDSKLLSELGVDCLFVPGVEEIYPSSGVDHTQVYVPDLSEWYCGAVRPGHFQGVATVVLKLLLLSQADVVVFGEKDFQQLVIIRRMVVDLAVSVEVVGVAVVREASGLALSSRNQFLSVDERAQAVVLFQTLSWVRDEILSGVRDFAVLEVAAGERLLAVGFEVDYVCVCCRRALLSAGAGDGELVVLAAGFLGQTRLIDNVFVDV